MDIPGECIKRVVQENVAVIAYDPAPPWMFKEEENHLLKCLSFELIRRFEYFGSTTIPNLSVKPIVDIMLEVTFLEEKRRKTEKSVGTKEI